jgi:excisionase family DNA binding protein
MTMESLVPLLTSRQVAEVLGVSRWHVDELARRGELVSVLVGSRSRRYHPDDITAFIRRKRDGQ